MNNPQRIRYWYQPRAAREYLLNFCRNDETLLRGVAQILYGTLVQECHQDISIGLDVSVAIPKAVWRSIGCHPRDIEALGILRPGWEHYDQGNLEAGVAGQCRQFTLDATWVLSYLRLCLDEMDGPWCNLIDGKTSKSRRFESVRPGQKSGRPRRTARVTINWGAAISRSYDLLTKAEASTHRRYRHRAIQAIRCLQSIKAQPTFRSSSTRPGFASYVPVYRQNDCGGRWFEQGGGFQGLPEAIKAALLTGTTNVNSDLRSCHVAASVALAGEINAHANWTGELDMTVTGLTATPREQEQSIYGVRDLISLKSAYDRIAEASNLPRKTVKITILAILYGGGTSAGVWHDGERSRSGAVMSTLLDHAGGDRRDARASYDRLMPLLTHVVTFAQGMQRAMEYMIESPLWMRRCRGRLRSMIRMGYNGNLVNAVGTSITVTLPASASRQDRIAMARRALSHVLTGIEQDCIGHLIVACQSEGVEILHMEHDGVVTDRPIPEVAIRYMVAESILANYARIEVKPYKLSDRDEVDDLITTIQGHRQEHNNGSTRIPPISHEGPATAGHQTSSNSVCPSRSAVGSGTSQHRDQGARSSVGMPGDGSIPGDDIDDLRGSGHHYDDEGSLEGMRRQNHRKNQVTQYQHSISKQMGEHPPTLTVSTNSFQPQCFPAPDQ